MNTDSVDATFFDRVEADYKTLEAPTTFAVVSDMDMVTINVFKTYNDFELFSTDFQHIMADKYIKPNSTENIIFPVAGMDIIKDYDYVPLVEKMLAAIG